MATCASVVALQTLSDTQRPESVTLVKVKRGPEKNPHVGHMWIEQRNDAKFHSSIRENLLNPGSIDVNK